MWNPLVLNCQMETRERWARVRCTKSMAPKGGRKWLITPLAWPVPSIDPGADDKDGADNGLAAFDEGAVYS